MAAVADNRPIGGADSEGQHWGMLLFSSVSAGIMAIFAGFLAVLAVVGVYVLIVWPLTFWDLGDLHLEQYGQYYRPALWSVFGAGTLMGFLCFSGVIFGKRKSVIPAGPIRVHRTDAAGAGKFTPRSHVPVNTPR